MDRNLGDQYMFGLPDDDALSEDVDSMDVHSRTEESLTSDLQFQDQLQQAVRSPAPSLRKRTKKVPSANQRDASFVDPRSRARPKKPHEPVPFLSIDNLPADRQLQDQGQTVKQTQSREGSSKIGRRPPINTPTPQQHSQTQSQLRSLSSTSWNTTVPKRHTRLSSAVKRGDDPNHQVKAPFKHAVNKSSVTQSKVSPDQQLKEQTALATIAVAKNMAKQKPMQERIVTGRLLKAKLKPLNVVNVEGPSMDRCRGIVADTRSYEASPSKTLQRHRQILNTISNDYMYERPQTMESLHRTSIASDLTEERDREIKDDLENAEADILNTDAEELMSAADGAREPPNTIASFSNPNSRFTAASMEHTGAVPSVGLQTPAEEVVPTMEVESTQVKETTHPLTPEETSSEKSSPADTAGLTPSPEKGTLNVNNSPMESGTSGAETSTPQADRLLEPQTGNQVSRGKSANSSIPAEEFEMSLNQVERQNRPQSVQDPNQRKEVRFADMPEGSDPDAPKRSLSAVARMNKGGDGKDPKEEQRGSCKDEANISQSSGRHEDDDESGGGDHVRGSPGNQGRQVSAQNQENRPSSRQGKSEDNNGGNTAGGGKQQTMKISTSSVDQGFEDPEAVVERNRSPVRRPRSQLGMWGDVMKPDENICSLSIEGVRQSISEAVDENVQQTNTTSSRQYYNGNQQVNSGTSSCGRKARPKSAKGLKEFKAEEEAKTTRKLTRPQSAGHSRFVSTNECVMMGQARMNIRDSQSNFKDLSRQVIFSDGSATTERKRVVSSPAVRRRPASAHTTRPSSSSARRPRSAVSSKKEAKNKQKCTYCGGAASKSINYHHGIFFSVCEPCSVQSSQKSKAMCNTAVCQETEPKPEEAEPKVTVEKEIVAMSHINGFVSDGQTSDQQNDPLQLSEGQMLDNLDDLEKSLFLVQQEIRSCIQQATNRNSEETTVTSDCSMADDIVEDTLPVEQVVESNHRETVQAEYSSVLTDVGVPDSGFAYRMSVFQFNDEQADTGEEKAGETGAVSSYEVTMMNESDGASVKAEKEAEGMALLNMLCQQLKNSEMIGGGEKVASLSMDPSPLQVIATTKTMSQSQTGSQTTKAIAPVAPLCFRVNARPPRGHLYYFAYGMDMNPDRFSTYIQRKTEERFWGLLYGFRLAFNKKGMDTEAGGFPNLLFDQGSAVEGCLYLISPEEVNFLDQCMGYPQHFEHVMLPVWLLNCNDPGSLGVAQYCVPALMYIAKDEWIHTGPDALDNSYALEQCLKGANLLSSNYRENMAAMRQETALSS